MKVLLALLLLTQIAKPAKPILAPTIEPQHEILITADAEAGKTVLVVPHASYENVDARCVIVYPREGSLGWLIDRKENRAELFYLRAPWPAFCKETKK